MAEGLRLGIGLLALPQQRLHGHPHRSQRVAEGGEGELAVAVLVPGGKEAIRLCEQARPNPGGGGVRPFAEGQEVTVQVRPADLARREREEVVGPVAVADDDGVVGRGVRRQAEQLAGDGLSAAPADEVDRGVLGGGRPEPGPLECGHVGLTGIRVVPLRPAGFVEMLDRRLLHGRPHRRHRAGQHAADGRLDGAHGGGGDGQAAKVAQQAADRPFGEMVLPGEGGDDRLRARPQRQGRHPGGRGGPHRRPARRAGPIVELVFGERRRHQGQFPDLVPIGRPGQGRIRGKGLAARTRVGEDGHRRGGQVRDRDQRPGDAGMAGLAARGPSGTARPAGPRVQGLVLRRWQRRIARGLPGLLAESGAFGEEFFEGAPDELRGVGPILWRNMVVSTIDGDMTAHEDVYSPDR